MLPCPSGALDPPTALNSVHAFVFICEDLIAMVADCTSGVILSF